MGGDGLSNFQIQEMAWDRTLGGRAGFLVLDISAKGIAGIPNCWAIDVACSCHHCPGMVKVIGIQIIIDIVFGFVIIGNPPKSTKELIGADLGAAANAKLVTLAVGSSSGDLAADLGLGPNGVISDEKAKTHASCGIGPSKLGASYGSNGVVGLELSKGIAAEGFDDDSSASSAVVAGFDADQLFAARQVGAGVEVGDAVIGCGNSLQDCTVGIAAQAEIGRQVFGKSHADKGGKGDSK